MDKIYILALYVLTDLSFIYCDLCSKQTVHYKIGTSEVILNISSEQISQLNQACTKQINIPDALFGVISIDKAKFGGNKGFFYETTGTGSRIINDTAFISNSCGRNFPSTKKWSRQISEGLQIYNISNKICVTFRPELNHRSLGFHVKGGTIKLSLTVNFAYCNRNNTDKFDGIAGTFRDGHETCRPICSADGIVSPCNKPTTKTTLSHKSHTNTQITQTTTSKFTHIAHASTLPQPITYPGFVPFVPGNTAISPSYIKPSTTSMVGVSGSTTKNDATTRKQTPLMIQTTAKDHTTSEQGNLQTDGQVAVSMNTTANARATTKVYDNTKETEPVSSETNVTTERTVDVVSTQRTTGQTDHNPISTRTEQPTVGTNTQDTFGLIEGLYVLVGCLVVFVLFVTFIYCVRVRNKSRVDTQFDMGNLGQHRPILVSDSSYISRWRDNWLIRYHGNERDEDNPSVFDDNIDHINGDFLRASNQELHGIHTFPVKTHNHDKTYQDPWPLIRLDSDFVRNTKSLERLPSNKSVDAANEKLVKTKLTQKVSKASSDSGIGRKESVDGGSSLKKHKTQSLTEKTDKGKERFRYIKRVNSHLRSRGSYNVSRAQRSASLSNYDFVQGLLNDSGDVGGKYTTERQVQRKREHPYQEISEIHQTSSQLKDERKKVNRQRNSSSMCSESSLTFEETIKEEIRKCEENNGALDTTNIEGDDTKADDANFNKEITEIESHKTPNTGYPKKMTDGETEYGGQHTDVITSYAFWLLNKGKSSKGNNANTNCKDENGDIQSDFTNVTDVEKAAGIEENHHADTEPSACPRSTNTRELVSKIVPRAEEIKRNYDGRMKHSNKDGEAEDCLKENTNKENESANKSTNSQHEVRSIAKPFAKNQTGNSDMNNTENFASEASVNKDKVVNELNKASKIEDDADSRIPPYASVSHDKNRTLRQQQKRVGVFGTMQFPK